MCFFVAILYVQYYSKPKSRFSHSFQTFTDRERKILSIHGEKSDKMAYINIFDNTKWLPKSGIILMPPYISILPRGDSIVTMPGVISMRRFIIYLQKLLHHVIIGSNHLHI